jgi:hypothetical protein
MRTATRYQEVFDYAQAFEAPEWETASAFAWDGLEGIARMYLDRQITRARMRALVDRDRAYEKREHARLMFIRTYSLEGADND